MKENETRGIYSYILGSSNQFSIYLSVFFRIFLGGSHGSFDGSALFNVCVFLIFRFSHYFCVFRVCMYWDFPLSPCQLCSERVPNLTQNGNVLGIFPGWLIFLYGNAFCFYFAYSAVTVLIVGFDYGSRALPFGEWLRIFDLFSGNESCIENPDFQKGSHSYPNFRNFIVYIFLFLLFLGMF